MPVTASVLAITLRWLYQGSRMESRRYFSATGGAFLTTTPVGVGEAYWNHVKAAWRACVPAAFADVFQSVLVEEVGGLNGFGEYSIPTVEKAGTRSNVGLGDGLPAFVNGGIRFAVGTRATRPGQMRLTFLHEADLVADTIQPFFLGLMATLAGVYSSDMVLGAPVATGVLRQHIVRWTKTVPAAIEASQEVVGYVVNPQVTTQLTRRFGRGQ